MAFDTSGSSFNTLLGIYTGTNVSALTLVASNNDFGGNVTSSVLFDATSNVIYRIAVDGFGGASGTAALHWRQSFVPVILTQLESTNVVANADEDATCSVLAYGTPAPTNQWMFLGTQTNAVTTNLLNSTNTSYTITNVQTNHAGYYSVVVGNSAGAVTSAVTTLFVHGDSAARLSESSYVSNVFRFRVGHSLTNRPYVVQTSTNLNQTNWCPVFTNDLPYWYTNLYVTNEIMRFYRAVTNN